MPLFNPNAAARTTLKILLHQYMSKILLNIFLIMLGNVWCTYSALLLPLKTWVRSRPWRLRFDGGEILEREREQLYLVKKKKNSRRYSGQAVPRRHLLCSSDGLSFWLQKVLEGKPTYTSTKRSIGECTWATGLLKGVNVN